MSLTKTTYLIQVNSNKQYESVVDEMFNCNAVCNTVKQAFKIAMWLSDIKEPDHTYRRVADTLRTRGIVFISEAGKVDECKIVITKIRRF